jgi:hypothetical protein
MKCIICNEEIEPNDHRGCNADPVADGRCCEDCDFSTVMPARLMDRGYTFDQAHETALALKEATRKFKP